MMMTREEREIREDEETQTPISNTNGMRNGKSKGMNGGRHLPEAHTRILRCVLLVSPLSPTDHRGRERGMETLLKKKAPGQSRRHATEDLPLSSLPVALPPLAEEP